MGPGLKFEIARRLPQWPELLTDAMESRRDAVFRWGWHDCAMFMVAMVEAMTGAEIWTTRYSTPREAREILASAGGLRLAVTGLAERHGWPARSDPRTQSQRGDVALVVDDNCSECLGIVVGDRVAVATQIGVAFFSLDHVAASWEIPLKGGQGG